MSGEEDSVERAREEVIEAMGRTTELYGAKRSYGRVYGELFFAREPLSLDELAERSDYAKSTVSTAASTLERFHLVRRRSPPGEGRKTFFEAETDFWRAFQRFLDDEVMREVRTMQRALESAEETLAAADDDRAAEDLRRVRQLQRIYDRSESILRVLVSRPIDRVTGVFDRLRD